MSRRAKIRLVFFGFALVALSASAAGCGSWQPVTTPGKCAEDRKWVPASADANGNQKEGYCEWEEGRKR